MSTIERAIERIKSDAPGEAVSQHPVEVQAAPEVTAAPPRPAPDATLTRAGGAVAAPATVKGAEVAEAAPAAEIVHSETAANADAGTEGPTRRFLLPRVDLDLELLKCEGMITPHMERSQIAEEYRHIKRPLLQNAFGNPVGGAIEHANIIMVTSAKPSEGKTFTAINLALSIALERDKTVLLVDADVARPSVGRVLKISPKTGLVDYLADSGMGLADVMLRTNMPKLRLLPAGRSHPHSTELLSSGRMKELVSELAARYPDRVVIFDSPPLLATSEASVLAQLAGQIVMVVEANKTRRQELKAALEHVDSDKYVGLVLNKSRRPFGADYYGYGYGYGYGEAGTGETATSS